MGAIATSTMAAGGQVIGIIPTFLREMGLAKDDVTTFIETATMDERKDEMLRQSDAFIVLPGALEHLKNSPPCSHRVKSMFIKSQLPYSILTTTLMTWLP